MKRCAPRLGGEGGGGLLKSFGVLGARWSGGGGWRSRDQTGSAAHVAGGGPRPPGLPSLAIGLTPRMESDADPFRALRPDRRRGEAPPPGNASSISVSSERIGPNHASRPALTNR
jgi:hypothetical protein